MRRRQLFTEFSIGHEAAETNAGVVDLVVIINMTVAAQASLIVDWQIAKL